MHMSIIRLPMLILINTENHTKTVEYSDRNKNQATKNYCTRSVNGGFAIQNGYRDDHKSDSQTVTASELRISRHFAPNFLWFSGAK